MVSLYMLTLVNYIMKRGSIKWRNLKPFVGVISIPLRCGVKYFFLKYRVLQEPSNPSIYTVQWGLLSQTLGVNSHAELVTPLTIAGCKLNKQKKVYFNNVFIELL